MDIILLVLIGTAIISYILGMFGYYLKAEEDKRKMLKEIQKLKEQKMGNTIFIEEAGICPKCGYDNLEYDSYTVEGDEGLQYSYICNKCKFEGKEWYNIEFSEHLTKDGEKIKTEKY